MKNTIFTIICGISLLVSGALFTLGINKISTNEEALVASPAFAGESMFSKALEEAGFHTSERVGDEGTGTWHFSGMAKFSQARQVRLNSGHDDMEKLRRFGEILMSKLNEAGVSGEGGLSVIYNNDPNEVKFRYYYTIGDRVGEIDIFKINHYFFFTQSETTNIRNF